MSINNTLNMPALAAQYIAAGYTPVRLHPNSKRPIGKSWQTRTSKPEHFQPNDNIGISLKDLHDVDLDKPQSRIAGHHLLPETPARFGHHGEVTHYIYKPTNPTITRTKRYGKPDVVVEIRTSSGSQTMAPGSWWVASKEGDEREPERIAWHGHGRVPQPAEVDGAVLVEAVLNTFALARMAADTGSGSYHDMALAMAGFCYHREIDEETAIAVIEELLTSQGSDSGHPQEVRDTYRRADEGAHIAVWDALTGSVRDELRIHIALGAQVADDSDFDDISNEAYTQPKNRWATIDVDSATLTSEPPAREWAMDGWIPRGVVTGLAGPPGVAKSTLALQLCMLHCLGRSFAGADIARGPAMFITVEDDANELWRRVDRLRDGHWVEADEVQGLHLLAAGQTATSLVDVDRESKSCQTRAMKELTEHIESTGATFVVLDLIGDFWTGNENARAEVAAYVRIHLGRLAAALNIAVVCISHLNKAGGVSGSTAWEGSYRSLIQMTRDGGERIHLQVMKANYAPPMLEPIVVRWAQGCIEVIPQEEMNAEQEAEIHEMCERALTDQWLGVETIRGVLEMNRAECRRCLNRMVELGLVETQHRGNADRWRRIG